MIEQHRLLGRREVNHDHAQHLRPLLFLHRRVALPYLGQIWDTGGRVCRQRARPAREQRRRGRGLAWVISRVSGGDEGRPGRRALCGGAGLGRIESGYRRRSGAARESRRGVAGTLGRGSGRGRRAAGGRA
eukprot:135812-Prymnesium_polylepis.2